MSRRGIHQNKDTKDLVVPTERRTPVQGLLASVRKRLGKVLPEASEAELDHYMDKVLVYARQVRQNDIEVTTAVIREGCKERRER